MNGEIEDLRVAPPGWRVAVAEKHPNHGPRIEVLPMVGWGRVEVDHGAWSWLPVYWDSLGLTYGAPGEVPWPLAPGEQLTDELRDALVGELP